ncbi:LysM peptidoglycan-binding domain-containing protein [Xanthomonas oryzae]|uniref:LysM peptidoglycan-binding domain-containing protein n=1 Tax=Xanthomonas oryzae TaxID=347 RepID=UPI001F5EE8B4|nr:LysM domain-containing protein [Xanthomonas oryzae]
MTTPEGYTHTYRYTYQGAETYLTRQVVGTSTNRDFKTSNSTSTYDAWGKLLSVRETTPGGKVDDRLRYFTLDAEGNILRRTEGTFENGAFTQDDGDKLRTEQYAFANGQYVAAGRFDGKTDVLGQMNAYASTDVGTYKVTVQAGDTLRGLAQRLYGNSNLWYVLADANAIDDDSGLVAGATLNVPDIKANTNDATTFKPFNASEAVGSTTPSLPYIPKPPESGCGTLGMIIMVVVAIVVTIYTAGAAAGAMGAMTATGATAASAGTFAAGVGTLAGTYGATAAVVGGAAGAFAGSLASQGVGSAMGQTSFSWRNVAASTIAGGATAGLGSLIGGAVTSPLLGAMTTAAVGNVSNYAANKLVGNDASFSWRSVAASAVSAGITQQLAPTISNALGIDADSYTRDIVSGITGGVVSAHVRQGMVGGAVNYQDVFVDAFGNVLSSSLNRSGLAALDQADQREASFSQWDTEDAASRQQMIADEEAGMAGQEGWGGDRGGIGSVSSAANNPPDVMLGSSLSADERARLATTTTYHNEYVDPYLIKSNGGTERTDVTQSFWARDNSPVSVELLPEEAARPMAARTETLSWGDELSYRVAGGTYGVLRSVVEGVVGLGVLAKSFAGAGMYETGLSQRLGLVDAHAADAELVGRTVAAAVGFLSHPIDNTVTYVNSSLELADRLEASGDLLGASAERSSMVFNIGTAAVDGYGLVRGAAPVAGRMAGALLSDLGDSMMGAGSLRSQIGAVGDVSQVNPFRVSDGIPSNGINQSPFKLGADFEDAGVGLASSEAFAQSQMTRRLSVRAFDDEGRLLPGRTQLDAAGTRSDTGEFGALEFKLSVNAPFTARQLEHFPYLQKNGGVVVGNNGRVIGLPAGSVLQPFDIAKVTGHNLPGMGSWWEHIYE